MEFWNLDNAVGSILSGKDEIEGGGGKETRSPPYPGGILLITVLVRCGGDGSGEEKKRRKIDQADVEIRQILSCGRSAEVRRAERA